MKMSEKESTDYFQSRPRGSQIGAWVSAQSSEIQNREVLEESFKKTVDRFNGEELIPKPPHWGGFRLVPQKIEFWQGQDNRLHDRIVFERSLNEEWKIIRLAP